MTTYDSRDDWARHAACKGRGALFDAAFDRGGLRAQQAAANICRTCPVRALCLAEGRAQTEPWGIWGGFMFKGYKAAPYDPLMLPPPRVRPRRPKPKAKARKKRGPKPTGVRVEDDPREELPLLTLAAARRRRMEGDEDPETVAQARAYQRIISRRKRARQAQGRAGGRPPVDDPLENLPRPVLAEAHQRRAQEGDVDPEVVARARAYGRITRREERARVLEEVSA